MPKKPNLISRIFRLAFCMFVVWMLLAGSEVTVSYNKDKAKQSLWNMAERVVKLTKLIY